MLWFTHIFVAIVFFLVGILFAVRNPKLAEWFNKVYLKLRGQAAEKAKEGVEYVKDKTGSIQVSPVSGSTVIKYLLRLGVPLAGVFALMQILKPNMVEAMFYKCCLVCVGYILAELIWVVGYKRTFDRQEKEGRITDVGRIAVLIFRGLLLGSVIVSLTLGL